MGSQRAIANNYLPKPDWDQDESENASGSAAAANSNNVHLWEESWDDDDAAEEFSSQLKCVFSPCQ